MQVRKANKTMPAHAFFFQEANSRQPAAPGNKQQEPL
jgi:hypothetical protein